MRRRAFIAGLGGAMAWPLGARGQQTMPVVGFLRSAPLPPFANLVAAFRLGLKEAGLVEGRDVAIEFRSAENQLGRLPTLVGELIRKPVAVIVANTSAALAAKAATATVPIIFVSGGDPIDEGMVASLNRPGGNVTGMAFFNSELGAKRLELLRQLVPRATIGMLAGPSTPNTDAERADVVSAARAVGQQLTVLDVGAESDIEAAFAALVQRGAGALLIGSGAFFNSHRDRIVALAARQSLPASYVWREAALVGGLMSYGPSQSEAYRQAGFYAARILKGEKPADLPVVQSTKFEFVLNLKTAKALGIEFHPQLLATADEVIE